MIDIDVKSLEPRQALQLFLICSVAYYHKYESLLSDNDYDYLSTYLWDTWDEWQDHVHAYLVTKGNLQSGSLYNVAYKEYPTVVTVATDVYLREHFQEYGGVV